MEYVEQQIRNESTPRREDYNASSIVCTQGAADQESTPERTTP